MPAWYVHMESARRTALRLRPGRYRATFPSMSLRRSGSVPSAIAGATISPSVPLGRTSSTCCPTTPMTRTAAKKGATIREIVGWVIGLWDSRRPVHHFVGKDVRSGLDEQLPVGEPAHRWAGHPDLGLILTELFLGADEGVRRACWHPRVTSSASSARDRRRRSRTTRSTGPTSSTIDARISSRSCSYQTARRALDRRHHRPGPLRRRDARGVRRWLDDALRDRRHRTPVHQREVRRPVPRALAASPPGRDCTSTRSTIPRTTPDRVRRDAVRARCTSGPPSVVAPMAPMPDATTGRPTTTSPASRRTRPATAQRTRRRARILDLDTGDLPDHLISAITGRDGHRPPRRSEDPRPGRELLGTTDANGVLDGRPNATRWARCGPSSTRT